MATPAGPAGDVFDDNAKNGSRADAMASHPDTWTRWFDLDTPTGYNNGDYETVYRIQRTTKICDKDYEIAAAECCINGDPLTTFTEETPRRDIRDDLQRYCTTEGLVCRNEDQSHGAICQDYSIRFRCHYNGDKDSDGNYPQFDVRIYIILAVIPILIFLLRMLWSYVCKRRRRQRRDQRRARSRLNRGNGDDFDDDSSIASGVANPPPSYQDLFGKTGHATSGSSVFAISRDNIPICTQCRRESCSVASIIGKQRSLQNYAATGQSVPSETGTAAEQEIRNQQAEPTNVSQPQQTELTNDQLQQYNEAARSDENTGNSLADVVVQVPSELSLSTNAPISFSAPPEAPCSYSASTDQPSSQSAPIEELGSPSVPAEENVSISAKTEEHISTSAPAEEPISSSVAIEIPISHQVSKETPNSPASLRETPSSPSKLAPLSPLTPSNAPSTPLTSVETQTVDSKNIETPNLPLSSTDVSNSPLTSTEVIISSLTSKEKTISLLAPTEMANSTSDLKNASDSPSPSIEVPNSHPTSTEAPNSPSTFTKTPNSHSASLEAHSSPSETISLSETPREVIIDITEADVTNGSSSESTVLQVTSSDDPHSDLTSALDTSNVHTGNNVDQINALSNSSETLEASASQSSSLSSSSDLTLSLNPSFLNHGDISEPCPCPCHRTIPLKQEGATGYDNHGYALDGDVNTTRHPSYPGMHIPAFGFHRNWSDLSVASTVAPGDLPTYDIAIELMKEKKTMVAESQTRSN